MKCISEMAPNQVKEKFKKVKGYIGSALGEPRYEHEGNPLKSLPLPEQSNLFQMGYGIIYREKPEENGRENRLVKGLEIMT